MLDQIADRLVGKAGLRTVGGAIGLAAIETAPATPAAYVFPIGDDAGPNRAGTGHSQPVTTTVGVLLILRAVGNAQGGRARDVVTVMRDAINRELAGWQPEGADAPIDYAGGVLVDVRPGEIWWLLRYRLQSRLWR